MEKTWGKNGGTKNDTIDRHPVQKSKGWNGHHPKSAAHTHLGQISQG